MFSLYNIQFSLDVLNLMRLNFVGIMDFLNCYLAARWPSLGHSRGGILTIPMLITAYRYLIKEGQREPCNEIGTLGPDERLVGFKPASFHF